MTKSNYGNHLKSFLDNNKLSLKDLSKMINIDYEAVRNLAYNRSSKINLYDKIAEKFNIPISVFLSPKNFDKYIISTDVIKKITVLVFNILEKKEIKNISIVHLNEITIKAQSYIDSGGENLEYFIDSYINNLSKLKIL